MFFGFMFECTLRLIDESETGSPARTTSALGANWITGRRSTLETKYEGNECLSIAALVYGRHAEARSLGAGLLEVARDLLGRHGRRDVGQLGGDGRSFAVIAVASLHICRCL